MEQSNFRDAFEEDTSTNESGERVEKPSEVAQNTSLLVMVFHVGTIISTVTNFD